MCAWAATTQAEEDAVMRARAPMLVFVSMVMVLLQSCTAMGVGTGIISPSCSESEYSSHCPVEGMFCFQSDGRCRYCGLKVPLDTQGYVNVATQTQYILNTATRRGFSGYVSGGQCNVYSRSSCDGTLTLVSRGLGLSHQNETYAQELCAAPRDLTRKKFGVSKEWMKDIVPEDAVPEDGDSWTKEEVETWCDVCLHPITRTVEPLTAKKLANMNVSAMSVFDWLSAILASVVIAMTILEE